jgi:hypothetical protein
LVAPAGMGTEGWYPGGRSIRAATGEVAFRDMPGRFPGCPDLSVEPKRRLSKIDRKRIFNEFVMAAARFGKQVVTPQGERHATIYFGMRTPLGRSLRTTVNSEL